MKTKVFLHQTQYFFLLFFQDSNHLQHHCNIVENTREYIVNILIVSGYSSSRT